MTTYSRELYQHHATQLRHQEQDIIAANVLLEVKERNLAMAHKQIAEMREAMLSMNAWLVILPIAGFCAGFTIAALVWR